VNTYVITLGKGDCIEWGMMDASSLEVDPNQDIVLCKFTGTRLRVVMRFEAPDWESARQVFDWKSLLDKRVPKHVLKWEEAKLMLEPRHVHESQEAPRPQQMRLHGEDPDRWAGQSLLAQGQEQQADGARPGLRVLRPPASTRDP
jgi:hypothetical protein